VTVFDHLSSVGFLHSVVDEFFFFVCFMFKRYFLHVQGDMFWFMWLLKWSGTEQ